MTLRQAIFLCVTLSTALVARGPSASAQTTSPAVAERFKEVGLFQRLGEQLPLDATFTDDEGRQVKLGQYFGDKPVLLMFVYYECPMLCNISLNGLAQVMHGLDFTVGREFEAVIISFDPRETYKLARAKKARFVQRYARPGSEHGWHFLTGDEAAIRRTADAAGFRYYYDEKTAQYAHGSGIILATREGKLSRYFYGVEFPPKDVRLGLVEASSNKIGTAVDQVLLLCFHYNPITGKYGFAIITVLRVAGIATVLAIVGFIARSLRKERRLRARSAPPPALGLTGEA